MDQNQGSMEYPNLTILTSEPKEVPAGSVLVYFERKSTEKNPVKESEKFRCVIKPSYSLPIPMYQEGTGEEVTVRDAEEVFSRAISEVFMEAAGNILKDFCTANKDAKEINASLLTFSAVVERMEKQATSKRMNGEQIGTWYDASQTKKDAEKYYQEQEKDETTRAKKVSNVRAFFVALASNNPGISNVHAQKMLGFISEQDLSNIVAKQCAEKLAALAKKDTSNDL